MVRITMGDRKGSFDVDTYEEKTISEIKEENPDVEMDELRVEGVADFDEESFDDYLDDLVGDFVAENNPKMRFSASRVLKELDPTMYRTIRAEEEDFQLEEARDNLLDMAETEEQENWVNNIFRNFF